MHFLKAQNKQIESNVCLRARRSKRNVTWELRASELLLTASQENVVANVLKTSRDTGWGCSSSLQVQPLFASIVPACLGHGCGRFGGGGLRLYKNIKNKGSVHFYRNGPVVRSEENIKQKGWTTCVSIRYHEILEVFRIQQYSFINSLIRETQNKQDTNNKGNLSISPTETRGRTPNRFRCFNKKQQTSPITAPDSLHSHQSAAEVRQTEDNYTPGQVAGYKKSQQTNFPKHLLFSRDVITDGSASACVWADVSTDRSLQSSG